MVIFSWMYVLRRAVTRSAVLDGQARHADAVGTLDLSDNTMGRDSSREGDDECV
jgi:hypothetical protein